MRRSGQGSGGGYGSRTVRHVTAPKREPRSNRVREPAVAQIGGNYGDHTTNKGETGWRPGPLYGGKGYATPVGPTDNVAACGVGGGRKVYASGSQGTQGSVNPGNPRPNTYRDALEQE
jgi:hypothetical protein